MPFARRSILAAGATGTLAVTAGCLDFVLGDGPLEFEAGRVAPSESALSETGYNEAEVDEETIEETVEVGGLEREVRATLWLSTYTKTRTIEGIEHDANSFVAVSVPGMEVMGRSFNPLEDMSNEELLEEFVGQANVDVDDIQHKDSFSLETLGEGRDVDRFTGETREGGETIAVELALTSFRHNDDSIVLLGTHPELLAEESANVELLMESAEHPV
ncbi:hypothetical protein EA462_08485 [Natrarchaeobius halalkaliphilus]|uniref:Uncharacterized protein n=1 Tax=Natrarchaeobius halalkaliphilus TaxID=1679091 RepID=A0A3N6LMK7_9EURY|nr:DUF6517 family protein [Natrarchaeobius halalkaliphilus]RQG90363.1 hypothetical protein EA462_08485 [Natrarchaeobius halalkaliphilus]